MRMRMEGIASIDIVACHFQVFVWCNFLVAR